MLLAVRAGVRPPPERFRRVALCLAAAPILAAASMPAVAAGASPPAQAPAAAPAQAPAAGPACDPKPAAGAARRFAGRTLVEALADLRSAGLNLIYSSDLVGADLIVPAEPPPLAPRPLLDRLLQPFALRAIDGPGGTILVVRDEDGRRAPSDATGTAASAASAPGAPSAPPLRERVRVEGSSRGAAVPGVTLGAQDLDGVPAIADDPARRLTALAGITAADRSAQFSVRGGEPGEARVRLDGLEIEEPFHLKDFSAFSSIVDAAAIGSADVLTGLLPAESGGGAAGLVDLTTLEPSDRGRTSVGLSTLQAGFLSDGRMPAADRSWLVSARSWRPDAFVDSVSVGGDGIGPEYNDLLGKMQFRLAGGSLLAAHVLLSQDTLNYRNDSGDARARADDDHRYAWLDWKTPWSPTLYSRTVLSSVRVSRARHGEVSDALDGMTQVDDARSYGSVAIRQDWIFTASDRGLVKWGFDARRLEADYAYRSHVGPADPWAEPPGSTATVDRALLLEPAGDEEGVYLAGQARVAAPLVVEAGVRRDRDSLTQETLTSPRIAAAWSPGGDTTVRWGWGRYVQPQAIQDLAVEEGVTTFAPAECAVKREIDLERRFAAGARLTLSLYDTDIARPLPHYENLFDPYRLFPESEPDRTLVAPERARSRGVEIGLRSDRGGVVAWRGSYALASAEDEIGGDWVPRSWDQRHTVDLGLDLRPGEDWTVGFAGVYHTGWPTTDVRAEQVAKPDGTTSILPVLGPRNALREPPYHRLDLKVTRRVRVGDGRLSLYLQVTNLYGRRNACCAESFRYLPQADGSVRVERTEDTWMGRHPVAGLTWDF